MTGPLRLLIASQPLSGGVAVHVLGLVDGLPRDRFEIHVACPRDSIVWRRLEGRTDVKLHAIGAHREAAAGDFRSLAALLPLVRGADVVHAHSSKAGFLSRLAAAFVGRRRSCIFTPHGWSFWSTDGAEARFYVALERVAAHWCRSIVTLSESEREAGLTVRVGRPEQYRVIPNGVVLERHREEPAPVPGRLLVVGRFAPPKRPDIVLRAFAGVAPSFPDAELHFVGDGPGRADVEGLSRELGLSERVRFLGTREDVPKLLTNASGLVLASEYEGCPLVVIEAMAAGVPVVATAVGGMTELIEDGQNGILAGPGDESALASALAGLLSSPEAARALGEAARRTASARFSHDRMVARLLALYEEAAGRTS
jgi:glycosyltransferase involved in cell wall biosynthesis